MIKNDNQRGLHLNTITVNINKSLDVIKKKLIGKQL